MKVSVIIPIYNVEKYLTKCLQSVVNQTLKDIEIICINDGSTDGSLQIALLFAKYDNRIKVYDTKHEGQSAARNFAISVATGEYIGFVDSDDWIDKNYFEKLYNTAKKYDADISCAGFRRCKYWNGTKRKFFKKEILTCDINEKVKLDNVPEHSYIWNKLYKRDSWLKTGITFPENKVFEDVAVILRILNELEAMVTVPNTYYHYRRRKNSTITINNKQSKQNFENAYNEMLKYAKENEINILPISESYRKLYLKIFGVKIMKVKYYPRKIKYLLFGFIPLATVDLI